MCGSRYCLCLFFFFEYLHDLRRKMRNNVEEIEVSYLELEKAFRL